MYYVSVTTILSFLLLNAGMWCPIRRMVNGSSCRLNIGIEAVYMDHIYIDENLPDLSEIPDVLFARFVFFWIWSPLL